MLSVRRIPAQESRGRMGWTIQKPFEPRHSWAKLSTPFARNRLIIFPEQM